MTTTPVYLYCEKRSSRTQMKHISVCRQCSRRGKCQVYLEYLQPGLWKETATAGKQKRYRENHPVRAGS